MILIQEHEGSLVKQITFFSPAIKVRGRVNFNPPLFAQGVEIKRPFPLTLQSRHSRGLLNVEQMRSGMWR